VLEQRIARAHRTSALAETAQARLGVAGEALLRATFAFIGELVGKTGGGVSEVEGELQNALDVRVTEDEQGRQRLSLAVPPRETLAKLLVGIGQLLGGGEQGIGGGEQGDAPPSRVRAGRR